LKKNNNLILEKKINLALKLKGILRSLNSRKKK
jgi:hypothetical protein